MDLDLFTHRKWPIPGLRQEEYNVSLVITSIKDPAKTTRVVPASAPTGQREDKLGINRKTNCNGLKSIKCV